MGGHIGGVLETLSPRTTGRVDQGQYRRLSSGHGNDKHAAELAQRLIDRASSHVSGWTRGRLFDDAELEPFRRALDLPTIGNALAVLASLRRAVVVEEMRRG